MNGKQKRKLGGQSKSFANLNWETTKHEQDKAKMNGKQRRKLAKNERNQQHKELKKNERTLIF